jgi:hypothetical protein
MAMAVENEKEKSIKDGKRRKSKPPWEPIRFSFVAHLNELVRAGNKTAMGGDVDVGKGGV